MSFSRGGGVPGQIGRQNGCTILYLPTKWQNLPIKYPIYGQNSLDFEITLCLGGVVTFRGSSNDGVLSSRSK